MTALGCRMESNQVIPPNAEQVEHVEIEDQNGSGISGANYSTNGNYLSLLWDNVTQYTSLWDKIPIPPIL